MAKAMFFMNVTENAKGKSKLIWQNINKLVGFSQKQDNKIPELRLDSKLVSDLVIVATGFNKYFLNSAQEIYQLFTRHICTELCTIRGI